MEEPVFKAFSLLFREAYSRCFGLCLTEPIRNTDAHLFQQTILGHTGLNVNPNDLKDCSRLILKEDFLANPSAAVLDALARYVLKVPYTNDGYRTEAGSRYPYWHIYRERHLAQAIDPKATPQHLKWVKPLIAAVLVLALAIYTWYKQYAPVFFVEILLK